MATPYIITIGAGIPNDCFLRLDLGAKVNVNNINFSTGGGATNAAVTFARQGLRSSFMGTVGHDPAGQAVLTDLDKEGVDTSHVSFSEKFNTGYSVLLLALNGERTILTYRGASTHYDASNFDLKDSDADWIYVSSMAGSMDVLDKIFHQARRLNIKICFNPGKGELDQPDQLRGLLQDVDILLVNKEEAQQIVSGDNLSDMVRKLQRIVPTVIISDGSNGVVASDGKTIVEAGIYAEVNVVDRTGAGDAFGSGFLSQWILGKSLRNSVVFASANSTSVVTKVGAKAGILKAGSKINDMDIIERRM